VIGELDSSNVNHELPPLSFTSNANGTESVLVRSYPDPIIATTAF